MAIIATCRLCKKSWDVDMDPPACKCPELDDDDWTLAVDEDG